MQFCRFFQDFLPVFRYFLQNSFSNFPRDLFSNISEVFFTIFFKNSIRNFCKTLSRNPPGLFSGFRIAIPNFFIDSYRDTPLGLLRDSFKDIFWHFIIDSSWDSIWDWFTGYSRHCIRDSCRILPGFSSGIPFGISPGIPSVISLRFFVEIRFEIHSGIFPGFL